MMYISDQLPLVPDDADALYLCPENITVSLETGERSARVSWLTPDGINITQDLEEGTTRVSYRLRDGPDCVFYVSVEGKSPLSFLVGWRHTELYILVVDVENQTVMMNSSYV